MRIVKESTDRAIGGSRISKGILLESGRSAVAEGVFDRAQHKVRDGELHPCGPLRTVRVADDHMQPAEGVGVGVRFVARVDHRAGAGGGRGDGLVQEVRALGDLEAVRGHAAGTGVQLAGDEERQQLVFDGLQRHEAADQVVFVAAEGVAGGVDVVFEHMDRGVRAVGFAQLALGLQG